MTFQTRKPTGKPSWPIMLIAGAEKAGKSYSAALASTSDLIGNTYWISYGEDLPDELGAIPGARFEIVLHDGTYRGVLNALTEATRQPMVDGKPNLIVLDSGGRIWGLLSDMANEEAIIRERKKAARFKRPAPDDEEVRISMDLWNVAADRWKHIMDVLRDHQGPSIITARLDVVTVMDADGKPTKEKDVKVQAHKSLPFDAGVVIHMRSRGETWLTGLRSVSFPLAKPRAMPDFTVDDLWRKLGLAAPEATTDRHHSDQGGAASVAAEDQLVADRQRLLDRLRGASSDPGRIANQWRRDYSEDIRETTDLDSLAALVATYESEKETAE